MDLGSTLVDLRIENGILQSELAAYLGLSIGTISNYERGVHFPDLETLSKIADYFSVTTDYLLGRTRYCHSLKFLERKLTRDFTIGNMINTALELTPRDAHCLVQYLELLKLRSAKEKVKKKKS